MPLQCVDMNIHNKIHTHTQAFQDLIQLRRQFAAPFSAREMVNANAVTDKYLSI